MFISQQVTASSLNPFFAWAAFDSFSEFSKGMTYGAYTNNRPLGIDFGKAWCGV